MRVRKQLIAALRSSRVIPTPDKNNWVLFAAMIEAALQTMGENTVEERLEAPVRRMLRWYVGDGDRKSTRLNSSHGYISYAVFCLKKKQIRRNLATHPRLRGLLLKLRSVRLHHSPMCHHAYAANNVVPLPDLLILHDYADRAARA